VGENDEKSENGHIWKFYFSNDMWHFWTGSGLSFEQKLLKHTADRLFNGLNDTKYSLIFKLLCDDILPI
jgi:hypothetical protein